MLKKLELQRNRFNTFVGDEKLLQMNIARDVSGNPEYIGYSAPGTAEDETGWLIVKYFYTGSDVDKNRIADGIIDFEQVWDDRAGYSY